MLAGRWPVAADERQAPWAVLPRENGQTARTTKYCVRWLRWTRGGRPTGPKCGRRRLSADGVPASTEKAGGGGGWRRQDPGWPPAGLAGLWLAWLAFSRSADLEL